MNEIETLTRRISDLEEIIYSLLKSDRYVFSKTLQVADGRNIQTGRGTGTKIGTDTDQKIGFYGVTPVIQPASANQAELSLISNVAGADLLSLASTNQNFADIQTLLNQIRSDLVDLGLNKGSA